MKRTILITALLISASNTAMANLAVSGTDSELGSKCYSDNVSGNNSVLYKVNDPYGMLAGATEFTGDRCPESYYDWNNNPEGECWISHTGSALYTCSKSNSDTVYPYASPWLDDFFYDREWTSIGENRILMLDGSTDTHTDKYIWTVTPTSQYGCAAGYYTTATTPSATMTCTRCPSSGGIYGTSETGNTSITGCYIPSGTTYNDGTGDVTLSGDCYYTK